jgi:hypothetical protein
MRNRQDRSPKALGSTAVALVIATFAATPMVAHATTVTFEWVNYFANTAQSPATVPSGALTLALPDSITTETFSTANLGSSAAALAMITAFSYTFSDGITVGLGTVDLATSQITTPSSPQLPNAWYTSNSVDPADGPAGVAPLGYYLLTGFILRGNAAGGTFQIANPAGLQGPPSNVGLAANGITPTFPPWASNDSGYWRMSSFEATVVPLPAALPLLVTGLASLGGLAAFRRRAAEATTG